MPNIGGVERYADEGCLRPRVVNAPAPIRHPRRYSSTNSRACTPSNGGGVDHHGAIVHANTAFIFTDAEPETCRRTIALLPCEPGRGDEPHRRQSELCEECRAAVNALLCFCLVERKKLTFAVRAAGGAQLVAPLPPASNFVVPFAVQKNLRALELAIAQPLDKMPIARERPRPMPIGNDEQGWGDTVCGTDTPQLPAFGTQGGCDIVNGDEELHEYIKKVELRFEHICVDIKNSIEHDIPVVFPFCVRAAELTEAVQIAP